MRSVGQIPGSPFITACTSSAAVLTARTATSCPSAINTAAYREKAAAPESGVEAAAVGNDRAAIAI